MTHSRKHYAVNRKRLAAMRAAKERLRLALLRAKGVGV